MDMGAINFKQDHDVTKKVCIEVAEFSRNLNHKAFLDWLMSIENQFDWYAMLENIKVCFLKAKLKGIVHLWWHSIENQLNRTTQPPINTWNGMKLKMKECFILIDYEKLFQTKMFNLKQDNTQKNFMS